MLNCEQVPQINRSFANSSWLDFDSTNGASATSPASPKRSRSVVPSDPGSYQLSHGYPEDHRLQQVRISDCNSIMIDLYCYCFSYLMELQALLTHQWVLPNSLAPLQLTSTTGTPGLRTTLAVSFLRRSRSDRHPPSSWMAKGKTRAPHLPCGQLATCSTRPLTWPVT